jgi:hypothetical protein
MSDQQIRTCDICGKQRINIFPGKTVDTPKLAQLELSFYEWDEKEPYLFDVCEGCLPDVEAEFKIMLGKLGLLL